VRNTNNYSKYITMAVNYTGSRNMNVAIINDKAAVALFTILYMLRSTHPQVELHCDKPTSSCASNTAVSIIYVINNFM
jgi:hypothetical protein